MAILRHPHNIESMGTIIQKSQEGRKHGNDFMVPQCPEHFGEKTDLAVGHYKMRNIDNHYAKAHIKKKKYSVKPAREDGHREDQSTTVNIKRGSH